MHSQMTTFKSLCFKHVNQGINVLLKPTCSQCYGDKNGTTLQRGCSQKKFTILQSFIQLFYGFSFIRFIFCSIYSFSVRSLIAVMVPQQSMKKHEIAIIIAELAAVLEQKGTIQTSLNYDDLMNAQKEVMSKRLGLAP